MTSGSDTPQALSADTPESVAAKLRAGCVLCGHEYRANEDPWRLTEELDTTERARLDVIRECDEAVERAAHAEAALAAERATAQAMREALEEGRQQIEYLHGKYQETGSGNAVIAQIDAALSTTPAEQQAPMDTLPATEGEGRDNG